MNSLRYEGACGWKASVDGRPEAVAKEGRWKACSELVGDGRD
jgi:hypothetical protein